MEIEEGFEYFKCRCCGAIVKEDQRPYEEKKIVYPWECYEDQGGCGRSIFKARFVRLKKEYVIDKEKFLKNYFNGRK